MLKCYVLNSLLTLECPQAACCLLVGSLCAGGVFIALKRHIHTQSEAKSES